jgi:tetratricopeptide (TPR) repeat protein
MLTELDNANDNLAAAKEKNESLKGAAKEKEKVNEAPLAAKVSDIQAKVDAAGKELDKAYQAYDKAIKFGEEDANLIQEKANSLYTNKRYNDAADTWKRLLDKGLATEGNMFMIGRSYYQGKEYDKAEAIFNQMIEKYPDHLQAYLWIANNASAKDPDAKGGLAKEKFIALLAKAAADSVKNQDEIVDALRYLGYNALQAKNYDEARRYYTRMVGLDPNNKELVIKALSSMSTLNMEQGNYDQAVDNNNKILALDPGNSQAKSTIQYISQLKASAKPKAHPNEITGVIKDKATGQPIVGASVRVKDTAAEAWTNAKGEYKFTMPEASTTLVISAKDYKSIEIPVTKVRVYNASLGK